MKDQLGSLIGSVESLTTERDQLFEDHGKIKTEMEKKLEVIQTDDCSETNFCRLYQMIRKRN